MVVEAVHGRAVQPAPAGDAQVVAVDRDVDPERSQSVGGTGDPIGLLVAELAGAADRRGSRGVGRGEAQDRDLIDGGRDLARPEVDRAQLRRADTEVGQGLADPVVDRSDRCLGDVRAHGPEEVNDRPACRVHADVAEGQVRVGVDRAGDEPEGGRRHVARDVLVDRRHHPPSFETDRHRSVPPFGIGRCQSLRRDLDAPRPQHPLRVIARRNGLPDRCPALGPERRQENRRLHLGTRDRRPPIDRVERLATDDGQRWEGVVGSGEESRAHRAKWFDDTGDRPPSQRVVAVKDAPEGQPGQDPGEEPEGRPGIAAVEVGRWLEEPVDAR